MTSRIDICVYLYIYSVCLCVYIGMCAFAHVTLSIYPYVPPTHSSFFPLSHLPSSLFLKKNS